MEEPPKSTPTNYPVCGSTTPITAGPSGEGQNASTPSKQKAILYFKTKPAILKTISVIVGLAALTLILFGYIKADLFTKSVNGSYRDDICRIRVSQGNETLVCPNRWMVLPQMYLIGIVWMATFIFLVLLTFVNLTRNQLFFKADILGHIFAGVTTTLSGLCVLCYFMQVIVEDMCKEENITRKLKYVKNDSSPDFNATLAQLKTKCPADQRNTYYQWYFLPGGICAFATGLMYIFIAVVIIMDGVAKGIFKTEVPGPISLVPTQTNVQKDKQETYPQQSPSFVGNGRFSWGI